MQDCALWDSVLPSTLSGHLSGRDFERGSGRDLRSRGLRRPKCGSWGARALSLVALLVLMGPTDAAAYRFFLSSDYSGSPLAAGDTFAVQVHFDTEGASDISLLSIAIDFDDTSLTYEQSLSSAASYALYTPGSGKATPGRWLEPVGSCAGAPLQGCGTWVGNGDQSMVVVDFVEHSFASGGATLETTADVVLASLVFRANASSAAPAPQLLFHSSSVLRLGSGISVIPNIAGSMLITPEPGTALLVGIGLAGLGGSRSRRRKAEMLRRITPAGRD